MKRFKIFQKVFFSFAMLLLFSACFKSRDITTGDAKIRIFNNVISNSPVNFFFDNILYNGATGQNALAFNTSSSYFVVDGGRNYLISARNSLTRSLIDSIRSTFQVGRNYSIYLTQRDTLDSTGRKMVIFEDTVRQNLNFAQVIFINYGSTLKSPVMITDRAGSFKKEIAYGQKTEYVPISNLMNNQSTLILNLKDSLGVQDTISYTNFSLGRVYTVIINGNKTGKLIERLVPNN